jgi:SEC-C motif-containing protein
MAHPDPAAFPLPAPADRCPCRSGLPFGECCSPLLAGDATAPTAVQLMRSRYTAHVTGDVRYLLATWHPSTRPAALELDPDLAWRSLEVIRTERGGPLDREGVVEFAARYAAGSERGVLHETSRFVREDRWRYVDAID